MIRKILSGLTIFLFTTTVVYAGENALNKLPVAKIPFNVNSDTILKLKKRYKLPAATVSSLGLSSRKTHGKQFTYYGLNQFSFSKKFNTILILQFYTEESYAWLVTVNKQGKPIDTLRVLYDNAEGSTWADAVISKNSVLIKDKSDPAAKESKKLYTVSTAGKFRAKE